MEIMLLDIKMIQFWQFCMVQSTTAITITVQSCPTHDRAQAYGQKRSLPR